MSFSPSTRTSTRTTAGLLQARSVRTSVGRATARSASLSGRVSSQPGAGIQGAGQRPASLFTSWYSNQALVEHPAAKVGISLGQPKFRLGYHLHHFPELAPAGWLLSKPQAEFSVLYVKQLERLGVDHILMQIAQVAKVAGVDQLALLCFEDIRKPDTWCHRRILAAWLEEQTGQVVDELPG